MISLKDFFVERLTSKIREMPRELLTRAPPLLFLELGTTENSILIETYTSTIKVAQDVGDFSDIKYWPISYEIAFKQSTFVAEAVLLCVELNKLLLHETEYCVRNKAQTFVKNCNDQLSIVSKELDAIKGIEKIKICEGGRYPQIVIDDKMFVNWMENKTTLINKASTTKNIDFSEGYSGTMELVNYLYNP